MKALNFPVILTEQQPLKIRVSRPSSARSSSSATLKTPLPVTIKDLDDVPAIYNHNSQTKIRPKIKIAVDAFHSPLRLDNQSKLSSEILEDATNPNRRPLIDVNTPKCGQSSPLLRRIGQPNTVMVKVKPASISESVSPLVKEPMLRMPDVDLYSDSETKGRGSFGTISTCDENEPSTPVCIEEGQNQLFTRRKNHATTLCFVAAAESANQLRVTEHGSMTPSVKTISRLPVTPAADRRKITTFTQTLKDLGFRTTFNSPKGSPVSTARRCVRVKVPSACDEEDLSPKKASKAQEKIQDAFEKAKMFDKMILQENFEKEDQEEERDFCELYEILNAK